MTRRGSRGRREGCRAVVAALVGVAFLAGCVERSPEADAPPEPISSPAAPAASESPGPAPDPDGIVEIDVATADLPDAIEAGIVTVLADDVPWGVLQPDGSYLLEDWNLDADTTRFGLLGPDGGDVRWLTERLEGADDWWFHPVGASGDWVVWLRQWIEKGHHDYSLGTVYAHDSVSGTTLDLTQRSAGPERRATHAAVVGDHVYWTEGDSSPLYSRELVADAPVTELLAGAWLEVDECVAANEGRRELLVSGVGPDGTDGRYRLGADGELRERPAGEPDPDRRMAGAGTFECAGATVVAVDRDESAEAFDDPLNRERLELTEPGRVTHFHSDDSSNMGVDVLTDDWLVFHLFNGGDANGMQLVYDRAGAQLYRLPLLPGSPGGTVVLGGDVLRFGVDDDPEDVLGESRRIVLARLEVPGQK